MTEEEWLACTDPGPMLEFLKGKASERKLRLFAVACCRLIWDELSDERSRKAVEVAERFADGAARKRDCQAAYRRAILVARVTEVMEAYYCGEYAAAKSAGFPLDATGIAEVIAYGVEGSDDNTLRMKVLLACFLRCIMGNPFRHPAAPSSILNWNDGTLVRLAQGFYENRSFDRLPMLADALEEAGCTDADILGHCRQPGEHVRGCWVVDLVLGRQ